MLQRTEQTLTARSMYTTAASLVITVRNHGLVDLQVLNISQQSEVPPPAAAEFFCGSAKFQPKMEILSASRIFFGAISALTEIANELFHLKHAVTTLMACIGVIMQASCNNMPNLCQLAELYLGMASSSVPVECLLVRCTNCQWQTL